MESSGFAAAIGKAALLVRRALLAIGLVAQAGDGAVNEGTGMRAGPLAATTAIKTARQRHGECAYSGHCCHAGCPTGKWDSRHCLPHCCCNKRAGEIPRLYIR